MLIATNGEFESPVRVYHWWPEKGWWSNCPIPSFLVKEAKQKGSRYLTYVETEGELDGNYGWIAACAICCPRDFPSRKMGRTIALGRLQKKLEFYGMRLEEK